MTDIKKYFKQLKKLDRYIDAQQKIIDSLNASLTSISPGGNSERVQTSRRNDKLADTIAKIEALKADINKDIDKYVDLQADARGLIEQLDDPVMRTVMYERYFQYKEFFKIAMDNYLSEAWVYKLHARALEILSGFIV